MLKSGPKPKATSGPRGHRSWRASQQVGELKLPQLLSLHLSFSTPSSLSFARRLVCCSLLSRRRCCFRLRCAASMAILLRWPKVLRARTAHKSSHKQLETDQLHQLQHEQWLSSNLENREQANGNSSQAYGTRLGPTGPKNLFLSLSLPLFLSFLSSLCGLLPNVDTRHTRYKQHTRTQTSITTTANMDTRLNMNKRKRSMRNNNSTHRNPHEQSRQTENQSLLPHGTRRHKQHINHASIHHDTLTKKNKENAS